jgi:hypothetical protein
MRKLTLAAVATLAAVVPSLLVAAPGQAKPPKPKAELVTKQVTATLASGRVTAGASVKNKGNKKAPASQATFYLSTDARQDSTDVPLGSAAVAKIKPKKSKAVAGTFAVPASVAAGSYLVVVCADSDGGVKERKETNNCKAATGPITVTGGSVTVSAAAGVGGSVAASNITGGACPGNVCTFPNGAGKVTFTPTASATYRFGAWTGATCSGFTTGAGNAITFTNPTTAKACTATFLKQVTISWGVTGDLPPVFPGSAAGAVTTGAGTCTAAGPSGTCTVDAGAATVTLTATGTPPFATFNNWGPNVPGTCTGVASGADNSVYTLTNVATDQSCLATFTGII